jgi:hypothetical protein
MLDGCDQQMLVFIPWAPIEEASAIPAVIAAARRHRATERQVALAWLLTRSPQVLPIPGSSNRPEITWSADVRPALPAQHGCMRTTRACVECLILWVRVESTRRWVGCRPATGPFPPPVSRRGDQ